MNEKHKQILNKFFLRCTLIAVIAGFLFYFVGKYNFRYREIQTSMIEETDFNLGELTQSDTITQHMKSPLQSINKVTLYFATYARKNHGTMKLNVVDDNTDKVLASGKVNVAKLKDNSFYTVKLNKVLNNMSEKEISIILSFEGTEAGNAITLYGNSASELYESQLYWNDDLKEGGLCIGFAGYQQTYTGIIYWYLYVLMILALLMLWFVSVKKLNQGKALKVASLVFTISKYRFLVKQLVSRDFKTKYKRSFFGVFWSLLNPLLTMGVQYVVFSRLFRSDIEYFAAYLMIGIVFYNFFTEAVGVGLSSIVANASLITKVYVPKYIYPVTKVFSSTINLFIALIPLLGVVLLTGLSIKISILMLPFAIVCVLIFTLGIVFLLCSSMVFFRDTQFLWGIISMIWMYATPIIYPKTILPEIMQKLMVFNPMYHFISFIRTIMISGVSPEPKCYIACILSAMIPFVLGAWVFKRVENKFVLYI